jgi:predicted nucleotidyltransferase
MSLSRVRANMVKEWGSWVTRIADAVKSVLPDAEVYVFGSVVRGDYAGGSDVDILIVSKIAPSGMLERAKIKLKIEDEAKLPSAHPFDMHIETPEGAEIYFRKAGKDIIKIR